MKRWITLAGAAAWLCSALSAQAGEVQPPDELIRVTVKEVLDVVRADKDLRAGNQKKLLELVDAKILPHFNFERMTKLAVGKAWKTATPEQKQVLVTEFRTMLVRTYTKAFTSYKDQTVEVKTAKVPEDAKEFTIKTAVNKPGGQPVLVDYEMEKTADGWKVFDVTIEGVSLVATNRSSFGEKVQQAGLEGLIDSLVAMNRDAASTPRKDAK